MSSIDITCDTDGPNKWVGGPRYSFQMITGRRQEEVSEETTCSHRRVIQEWGALVGHRLLTVSLCFPTVETEFARIDTRR